jgi:chromosome segregation ATPase
MLYDSRIERLRAELNRLIEKRQIEEYRLQEAQITINQLDSEIAQIEYEISAIDFRGYEITNSTVENREDEDDDDFGEDNNYDY